MNERIKELVDKTNDLMDKEYSTDWWNAQSFYQSIWQEKFAQLIVEHIMEKLDREIGLAYEQDQDWTAATLSSVGLEILDDFEMELPNE